MFTVRAKEHLVPSRRGSYAGGYDGPWRMFARGAADEAQCPPRGAVQRNIGRGEGRGSEGDKKQEKELQKGKGWREKEKEGERERHEREKR